MIFWLGTHKPVWLGRAEVGVPLMVSHRTLHGRATLPRAVAPWVLDSGAFSEVRACGPDAFADGPEPYAEAVHRYAEEVGRLVWFAGQDWMCESFMLARTGLSLDDHLHRTVDGHCALEPLVSDVDADLVPTIQGDQPVDYERCIRFYEEAGVDLRSYPVVGMGSVCRRQSTNGIAGLVHDLAADGYRLHGFGVKRTGLSELADDLASSDSMAWSFDARHADPLPGCRHGRHGTSPCANCPRYALRWRTETLRRVSGGSQLALFGRAL